MKQIRHSKVHWTQHFMLLAKYYSVCNVCTVFNIIVKQFGTAKLHCTTRYASSKILNYFGKISTVSNIVVKQFGAAKLHCTQHDIHTNYCQHILIEHQYNVTVLGEEYAITSSGWNVSKVFFNLQFHRPLPLLTGVEKLEVRTVMSAADDSRRPWAAITIIRVGERGYV